MAQNLITRWSGLLLGGVRSAVRIAHNDLARSETILSMVLLVRLFYYCVLKRDLKTLDSENAFPVTLKHNLKSLTKKLNRMQLLIRPLSVLEQVSKDAKILVIGPRNEWDLLLLYRYGFSFGRCAGLDLISYSPKIVLGDMHKIPFQDGEFDVVLCGWTISYSAEPKLACQEIARVCKSKGIIGIGVEYFVGDEQAQRDASGGYLIGDSRLSRRVNSCNQILALFDRAGAVFFSHDAPLRRSRPRDNPPSNCAVLFENA